MVLCERVVGPFAEKRGERRKRGRVARFELGEGVATGDRERARSIVLGERFEGAHRLAPATAEIAHDRGSRVNADARCAERRAAGAPVPAVGFRPRARARAQAIARAAASGWSPGAPKGTWIASPMILATVHSWANTISVMPSR